MLRLYISIEVMKKGNRIRDDPFPYAVRLELS